MHHIVVFLLIILGRICLSVGTPRSRAVQTALQIKRLKQIKDDGKTYRDYLDEQARVSDRIASNDKPATSSVCDSLGSEKESEDGGEAGLERGRPAADANEYNKAMKKVVQYKQQQQQQQQQQQKQTRNLKVAFLPDVSASNPKRHWFYRHLATIGLSPYRDFTFSVEMLSMPDVFELNTKRYEQSWLGYMRDSLSLSDFDCVVGHGTSAEALLRFLESSPVRPSSSSSPPPSSSSSLCTTMPSVVLIDTNSIYTAGERHGRA